LIQTEKHRNTDRADRDRNREKHRETHTQGVTMAYTITDLGFC
jgi:hypothetical protein